MKSIKILLIAILIEITGLGFCYIYATNLGAFEFSVGIIIACIGLLIGIIGCFIPVGKKEKIN